MEETPPPLEEPIVATVHLDAELQNTQPHASFETTNLPTPSSTVAQMAACDIEETLRKLTQFAMSNKDESASELAEQIPDSFSALFNSIVMLKSHSLIAKQEAAEAVEDAKIANRRAKTWKQRAVLLTQSNNELRTRVDALQVQQQRTVHERAVLKRAYKQLAIDSAFDVARYVEHAIALHEDHLQQKSGDCSLEVTSATSISFDDNTTTEQEDSDVNKEDSLESSAVFISSDLSDNYKPLQLQVNSASIQKQLLQKHRPRPKLRTDDLLEPPVSPRGVRNLTIPSIIYQPHAS